MPGRANFTPEVLERIDRYAKHIDQLASTDAKVVRDTQTGSFERYCTTLFGIKDGGTLRAAATTDQSARCSTPFGIKDGGTARIQVHEYHAQYRGACRKPAATGGQRVRFPRTVQERQRNHLLGCACTARLPEKQQAIDFQDILVERIDVSRRHCPAHARST